MNKIVSTKTTSAIFLAIVLVTGTIAAISPLSFMTTEASAQAQPYYNDNRMDHDYNSYGYSDYRDDRKKYDNYGYSDYGMDKDKKSYGSDSYYKSQYSSYDKHDKRDKSKKDSSKSVSINKLNCINTNLNINGNNTGNVSIGNKGTAEEGYFGTSSYDGSVDGYGGSDDGYNNNNKQGKGFECIINNNNNNTNIVTVGGGGNVTDGNGNGNVIDTCEECFNANATLARIITLLLAAPGAIPVPDLPGIEIGANVRTIAGLCDFLENLFSQGNIPQTGPNITAVIEAILEFRLHPPVSQASITALVNCLLDVDFTGGTDDNTAGGLVPFDINTNTAGGLAASNINTDTSSVSNINIAGDLAPSFSSPPTTAQETEEDLSALEKMTKLKKQWLELLP